MLSISISLRLCRELRSFLVLASAFLLIQEFQSSQLTVWPVDHSCRLPTNLSQNEYILDLGPNRSFTAQVVQLNLFDVAVEESPVVAKATSEGIHFEDIGHCYQHPVETDGLGQTTIDKENIEPCRHGLHFELHSNNLSTVAYFQLACDRQWLRVLSPQSIGLGFLLGTLLAYAISRSLFPSTLGCRKVGQLLEDAGPVDDGASFNTWLYFQAMGLLLIYAIQLDLAGSYTNILACSLLRSLVVGLCLARVLFDWTLTASSSEDLQCDTLDYMEDNRQCLVCTAWMYVAFQAIYSPLVLRVVNDWIQLNKWLTIEVTVLAVLTAIGQLLCKRASTWTNLHPGDQPLASTYEPVQPLGDEASHEEPPVQIHQSRQHHRRSDNKRACVKLCEFCLIKEEPLHAIAMIHQGRRQQQHLADDISCHVGGQFDSSVPDTIDDFATYQPTTVPNFAYDDSYTLASGNSGRRQHNFASFHRNLFTRSTICQLWLLAFCVCLNYFLLRFLPDHALLHSETLASRLARKIQYRDTHPLAPPSQTTTTRALPSTAKTTGNDSNHHSTLEEDFDYSSINYGSHAIELMRNSGNPFQVLATTVVVNGWLTELAVMLLHVASLSRFSASYFKLKRLLTLVKFGAQVLAVEWILLGLLRRQNHLIEWQWLQSGALALARFAATLVLFNYFFTALKISQKLRTNQLIRFLPSATGAALALLLASLAPVLEKVDLVIIPVSLAINNALAYLISMSLGEQFKQSLCPMLFSGGGDGDDTD